MKTAAQQVADQLVDRVEDALGDGIRTTITAGGKSITLDEDDWEKVTNRMQATNPETGEIDFSAIPPSWEELGLAFAEEERASMELDSAKEEVKRLKLRHEETKTNLGRMGRRVRMSRRARG